MLKLNPDTNSIWGSPQVHHKGEPTVGLQIVPRYYAMPLPLSVPCPQTIDNVWSTVSVCRLNLNLLRWNMLSHLVNGSIVSTYILCYLIGWQIIVNKPPAPLDDNASQTWHPAETRDINKDGLNRTIRQLRIFAMTAAVSTLQMMSDGQISPPSARIALLNGTGATGTNLLPNENRTVLARVVEVTGIMSYRYALNFVYPGILLIIPF